ncbi:MAG: hypothetical protein QM765_04965 [Myxococcales bacterium]
MKNLRVLIAVGAAMSLSGCGLLGGGGGFLPGGLGGPRVPPLYGPYEVKGDLIKLGLGDREMKAQVAIEVPPDKAYAPIDISARGPNFDAAAAQVKKAMDDSEEDRLDRRLWLQDHRLRSPEQRRQQGVEGRRLRRGLG